MYLIKINQVNILRLVIVILSSMDKYRRKSRVSKESIHEMAFHVKYGAFACIKRSPGLFWPDQKVL